MARYRVRPLTSRIDKVSLLIFITGGFVKEYYFVVEVVNNEIIIPESPCSSALHTSEFPSSLLEQNQTHTYLLVTLRHMPLSLL